MLLDTATKSIILRSDDPLGVREAVSASRIIDHKDYNVVVKHDLENVMALQSIGIYAPSPILTQYKWPGKYYPFDHQKVMADFLTRTKRGFNLSEMGVGKSAAALWAADWLMQQGVIKKALVLSPLSTLDRVWMNDIFDVLMHRTAVVVHGTCEKRLKALDTDVDFYILNHDGVSIEEINKRIRTDPDINLVILDEASMYRNASTSKYRSLLKMIRPDMWLWVMTGTPCPNAPTDAWALAKLVDSARVPKYFGGFRRQTMTQVTQFKWIPRNDAYEVAYNAMQPAVRFKKADCLTLPPVTTQDRAAPLSKEQKAAVKSMINEMRAEAKEKEITAVNAADKIGKLRQILCGAVKTPDGKYAAIPHSGRTEVLFETIENASAKVIVIVPFKGIINVLAEEVKKKYSVEILNGDVSPKRRDKIIRDFKTSADPHVLLCHPRVMSHGLNLTEADATVFYAPIYSNDEFQQVIERFNRTGQTRKMTITRIGAHPLEWNIYKMVDKRKDSQDNILALYKAVTA